MSQNPISPRKTRSYWKIFTELHPVLLERYCQQVLVELESIQHRKASARERYFDLDERIYKRTKTIRRIFDDYRRSTAIIHLAAMRQEELLSDADLARFSEDTQCRIKLVAGEE
ncbi:MAG: hypothetical protein RL095_1930 [Verrucomicrobiota bacterium]